MVKFNLDAESLDAGRSSGIWWIYRSARDYEARFRYHPHNGKKFASELHKQGFITRINFFVNEPTSVIYDVIVTLLKNSFKVASPMLAGTHILGEWKIFELQNDLAVR